MKHPLSPIEFVQMVGKLTAVEAEAFLDIDEDYAAIHAKIPAEGLSKIRRNLSWLFQVSEDAPFYNVCGCIGDETCPECDYTVGWIKWCDDGPWIKARE